MKLLILLMFGAIETNGLANNVVDCAQCFVQTWDWTAWKCSTQCEHNSGPVDPYGKDVWVFERIWSNILLLLK